MGSIPQKLMASSHISGGGARGEIPEVHADHELFDVQCGYLTDHVHTTRDVGTAGNIGSCHPTISRLSLAVQLAT